jgi:hypothetical protein
MAKQTRGTRIHRSWFEILKTHYFRGDVLFFLYLGNFKNIKITGSPFHLKIPYGDAVKEVSHEDTCGLEYLQGLGSEEIQKATL